MCMVCCHRIYGKFSIDRLDVWFIVIGCIMYGDFSMDRVDVWQESNELATICMVRCHRIYGKFSMHEVDLWEVCNGLARCKIAFHRTNKIRVQWIIHMCILRHI